MSFQNGDLVMTPNGLGLVNGGQYEPVSMRQYPGEEPVQMVAMFRVIRETGEWSVIREILPVSQVRFLGKTEEEVARQILGENYL